jgi:hypothetical protein
MRKTLGGSTFIYNGNIQDYNYKETVHCLAELCDEVAVFAGGTDNTLEDLFVFTQQHSWKDKVMIFEIEEQEWNEQKGREKLSHFSNKAIDCLISEWNFYLQCDEILHERSFENVREAIEHDVDSYLCKRYNMWMDPLHHLVVEEARKPCSSEVIRLARTKYRCFNDAESIMAPFTHIFKKPGIYGSDAFEIYHTGYIREGKAHAIKAKNMLVDIFGMEMDSRIGDEFDYSKFPFSGGDIQKVPLPLPKFILKWAQERYPDIILSSNGH